VRYAEQVKGVGPLPKLGALVENSSLVPCLIAAALQYIVHAIGYFVS
jgi:hypothetical protein